MDRSSNTSKKWRRGKEQKSVLIHVWTRNLDLVNNDYLISFRWINLLKKKIIDLPNSDYYIYYNTRFTDFTCFR